MMREPAGADFQESNPLLCSPAGLDLRRDQSRNSPGARGGNKTHLLPLIRNVSLTGLSM